MELSGVITINELRWTQDVSRR